MEHRTVRDILQLVSQDKLYADFVDIDNTRANPNGYGYYDIWHSAIGPFMIYYDNVRTNLGTMETITEFRVPDIEYVSGTFGSVMNNGKQDPNHIAAVNFLHSLKNRSSAMSLHEAIDKYHWIMSSPECQESRAAARQHYVNACVVADLIDERLELGSNATKYSTLPNGGIRITTHFPFSGIEKMNLYCFDMVDDCDFKHKEIKVEIPAAGFVDTFDNFRDYKNKMAFEHVDNYIKLLKSHRPMTPRNEEFGRFASDYRRTMFQIVRARQK